MQNRLLGSLSAVDLMFNKIMDVIINPIYLDFFKARCFHIKKLKTLILNKQVLKQFAYLTYFLLFFLFFIQNDLLASSRHQTNFKVGDEIPLEKFKCVTIQTLIFCDVIM